MADPARLERARARLDEHLQTHGLRHSRQRDAILEAFLDHGRHTSAEELYQRVRAANPRVGFTTVYRTLSLLVDAGIAGERQFGEGVARYEPVLDAAHHDHLVCEVCGAIEEFENSAIERLQEEVAAARGFQVRHHRLELYGVCGRCVSGDR